MTKYQNWLVLILLIIIVSIPIFRNLGSNPVHIWDEARYGVNAIEMMNSDNPLIVTFNNNPDYWNSKPPLAVWLISLSYSVFGINEFALRFPSALAMLFSIFIILIYSRKIIGSYTPGVFTALAMVCTTGIIRYHGARTGDVDSLLTFFILSYSLSYLILLIKPSANKTIFFSLFFLGLIFAFLTKGIAALIPLPALLVATFAFKKFRVIVSSWQLYASIGLFLAIGLGYYFLRNYYDGGYIDAVLKQDFGMYSNKLSPKNHHFNFYFNQIVDKTFYPFAFYIPISLILGIYTKNIKLRKTLYFAAIFVVVFLLIHSLSKTGNSWYDIPVYPLLSLLFGFSLYISYELLKPKLYSLNKYLRYSIIVLSLVLVFYYPYLKIMKSTIARPYKSYYDKDWEGAYMKDLKARKPEIKEYTVNTFHLTPDQVIFYMKAFNSQFNYKIQVSNSHEFSNGEKVLTCHKVNRDYISKHYKYELIDSINANRLYKILEKKRINKIAS